MRSASLCVLSIHWLWLATLRSGCARRMDVLARMTVSGVLSSWDASATNRCCWSHARATGPSAQREKNTLMTRNTARAPTPTAASVRASDCQEDAALASAKATNVVPPTARFE